MTKKLSQYLRENEADTKYNYVGTIYGDSSPEWPPMTGSEIAEMMEQFGDNSPMIDHPAYGGRGGFYIQSWNIHYQSENNLTQECVFEEAE